MKFKTLTFTAAVGLSVLIFTACNNNNNNESNTENTADTTVSAITINPFSNSPEFPDAELSVENMKAELSGTDSVKITIAYAVKNYELKNQTPDAGTKGCANSNEGQHIHFILDNKPYAALYEPVHTFTVPVNSEHYVMSFLSRSYHESLKNPSAGVLKYFSVDNTGKITEKEVPSSPMVFYSRPKGDYLGDDTKKVLLDFYVYNATLGSDAKVKATINGTAFVIDKWQPYFIENAPMGDLEINLQLTDMNGGNIEGNNTSVSRTSRLAIDEPMN